MHPGPGHDHHDHEDLGHGDGHGHGHGHGHTHGLNALDAVNAGARYRRPLTYAFVLTVGYVLVEFVAGFLSGSLALLSDAGHMLSDAGGLGMSLAAITLASRGTAAVHRTFGWYRLEILSALVNTVLLFAVAAYVLYEAIARLGGDHEVASTPMVVVAVVGLLVNLMSSAGLSLEGSAVAAAGGSALSQPGPIRGPWRDRAPAGSPVTGLLMGCRARVSREHSIIRLQVSPGAVTLSGRTRRSCCGCYLLETTGLGSTTTSRSRTRTVVG
jgi:hypothetical protein